MARWLWGRKKEDGPQRCFAEDLCDRTVAEYNEERHRQRRFFEAYHGVPGIKTPMFKILCNVCKVPVEFGDTNGITGQPHMQVICPKCCKTDYVV